METFKDYVDQAEFDNDAIEAWLHVDRRTIMIFECSTLDHCCGVIELGNFTVGQDLTAQDHKQAALFLKALVSAKTERTCQKSFIATTNEDQCDVEDILENSECFTVVKEFRNSSSKNLIKIWVSHN